MHRNLSPRVFDRLSLLPLPQPAEGEILESISAVDDKGESSIKLRVSRLGVVLETARPLAHSNDDVVHQTQMLFRTDGRFLGAMSRIVFDSGFYPVDFKEASTKTTKAELWLALKALKHSEVRQNLTQVHPTKQIG